MTDAPSRTSACLTYVRLWMVAVAALLAAVAAEWATAGKRLPGPMLLPAGLSAAGTVFVVGGLIILLSEFSAWRRRRRRS